MAEENKKPVLGEMISNFPVKELKRMITNSTMKQESPLL